MEQWMLSGAFLVLSHDEGPYGYLIPSPMFYHLYGSGTRNIVLYWSILPYSVDLTLSLTSAICVQLWLMFTLLFIVNLHYMFQFNWPSSGEQLLLLR
jgi:hypothetical protein